MKEIRLSNGMYTQVNDEDFFYLCGFNWHITKSVKDKYAGYVHRLNKRTRIYIHREIIRIQNKIIPSGQVVDHIDRNTLNNQRNNLRVVTVNQNMQNKSKYVNNTSGITGVSINPKCKLWQVNYKGKSIGYFQNKEEAIELRKKYEKEHSS